MKPGLANAWTLKDGEEPPLAAHLVTPRRGYIHHGLYVGNGRIIHYPGLIRGFRLRAVEEVSLEQFARGRPVAVRADSNRRFDREDVVRRARSRLGENRYHIIRNNCEHFCEWCLSGVSRSRQLESVLGRLGATGHCDHGRNSNLGPSRAQSDIPSELAPPSSPASSCLFTVPVDRCHSAVHQEIAPGRGGLEVCGAVFFFSLPIPIFVATAGLQSACIHSLASATLWKNRTLTPRFLATVSANTLCSKLRSAEVST
jgi:Lecithin retinol acyltransferase